MKCRASDPAKRKMKGRANGLRGFTLIEVLIAVLAILVLAALAVPIYTSTIERMRKAEALTAMDAIRRAEYLKHGQLKTYLNAENTEAINRIFGLDIVEHWFSYKIIDASDLDFRIIATRLGAITEAMGPMVIEMGPDGEALFKGGMAPTGGGLTPITGGEAGGGSGAGGYSGGGSGGGSGGSGGGAGGSGGGSGGSGGGGSSGGGSTGFYGIWGAPGDYEVLDYIPRGDDEYTNWPDTDTRNITGDDGLELLANAFDFLGTTEADAIMDDLYAKGIEITFGPEDYFDANPGVIAAFWSDPSEDRPPDTPAYTPHIGVNPAYLNEDYRLIAAVLAHEGTHFQQYLDGDLYKEITDQISIVDVEFEAFWNSLVVYQEVRDTVLSGGSRLVGEMEALFQIAQEGEASLRAAIAQAYVRL